MIRTFGFELEVANVEKAKVKLPKGYSWSEDETIINTNGKAVKSSSKFGGELNTRPFKLCFRDRDELREVFKQIFEAGGKCTWCHGFAVHIYAGDFDVEQLAKIFILSYYTAEFIKEYAHVGKWSEWSTQAPTPTIEFVQKARQATNFEELKNVFANSSNKGFIRHIVNIASYFKHQTIEFRIFNTTYDLEKIQNSVLFAFRFVKYAVEHTEDDFMKIKSMKDFKRELKIHGEIAERLHPMIFSGSQNSEKYRFVSDAIDYSSPMLKELLENVTGDELVTVNPNMFFTEVKLIDKIKKLTIYNNSEFNDLIYRLASGELKLKYKDKAEFLNEILVDDDNSSQVLALLIFFRIKKFFKESYFAELNLDSYKSTLSESIERIRPTADKITDLFSKAEYKIGNINDAIAEGKDVFYQFEHNKKTTNCTSILRKYSTLKKSDINITTNEPEYYEIEKTLSPNQKLFVITENETLDFTKIAKFGKQILYYSLVKENNEISIDTRYKSEIRNNESFNIIEPPDDLDINDPSLVKIVLTSQTAFKQLQKTYVKKVHKIKPPRFTFLVMYDKYTLGGFGFDYPKEIDRDYDVFLASDFSVNNKVFRLAKFILLIIKTKEVKRELQRKLRCAVERMATRIYTTNSVSMKYRGPFKKTDQVNVNGKHYLVYEADFGSINNINEAISKYQKMKRDAEQNNKQVENN